MAVQRTKLEATDKNELRNGTNPYQQLKSPEHFLQSSCPHVEETRQEAWPQGTHTKLWGNAEDIWACLHDSVSADLLPRWQKVRQSRATQPRCTDVPDWVTTSTLQSAFWDHDSFNCKCHGRQLAQNRCNLGGGTVYDIVMQPSPEERRSLRPDLGWGSERVQNRRLNEEEEGKWWEEEEEEDLID